VSFSSKTSSKTRYTALHSQCTRVRDRLTLEAQIQRTIWRGMRDLANNKLTGARIIAWGPDYRRPGIIQPLSGAKVRTPRRTEAEQQQQQGRSSPVSDGQPARIGNEEEKQQRKRHPLAIRRSV
jgi:hypothetical protein